MASQRQSNIELCRLVSCLLVMLVHTTAESVGWDVTFGVHLLLAFSAVGVNVFILITGYFSVTPKKMSLFNLAFICLFWMSIKIVCRYIFGEEVDYSYAFFITSSNWFIASYIALLFLSPILNVYSNSVGKNALFWGVMSLLFVEIYFDWLPPNPIVKIGSQNGYSVFSFAVLYLLARFIRLYGIPQWFKKYCFLIYIGCTVVIGVMIHIFIVSHHKGMAQEFCAYINPLIIISSVAFFMIFERIHIQSRLINHIAKSALAVLLGHTAIFFLYSKQFRYIYTHYFGINVVIFWILSVVLVFVISIAIDQIRLILYKPIEKRLRTKISNNDLFKSKNEDVISNPFI